jgi:hypothetical protein
MGKVVRAMPIRLGECCSVGKFLFCRLALFLDVFVEQLLGNNRDILKYVRINDRCYEQVERAAGNSQKSVQSFFNGGKIE